MFLVHFIYPEFLGIYYYSTKFRVQKFNSEMKKIAIDKIQGSIYAHQKNPPHKGTSHASPTTGVNKH